MAPSNGLSKQLSAFNPIGSFIYTVWELKYLSTLQVRIAWEDIVDVALGTMTDNVEELN